MMNMYCILTNMCIEICVYIIYIHMYIYIQTKYIPSTAFVNDIYIKIQNLFPGHHHPQHMFFLNTEPILSVFSEFITSFSCELTAFHSPHHSVTSKCWKSVVMTNKAPSVCPAPPVVSVSWNALGKSKVIKALPDVGAFPIPPTKMHLHWKLQETHNKLEGTTRNTALFFRSSNQFAGWKSIFQEKIYLHLRWDVTIHLRPLKTNHRSRV